MPPRVQNATHRKYRGKLTVSPVGDSGPVAHLPWLPGGRAATGQGPAQETDARQTRLSWLPNIFDSSTRAGRTRTSV